MCRYNYLQQNGHLVWYYTTLRLVVDGRTVLDGAFGGGGEGKVVHLHVMKPRR